MVALINILNVFEHTDPPIMLSLVMGGILVAIGLIILARAVYKEFKNKDTSEESSS